MLYGRADAETITAIANDRADVLMVQELTLEALRRLQAAGIDRIFPYHLVAPRAEAAGAGDASNFAARQLTSRIASDADLVLTMTRTHRDIVLELAPHRLHRTFTLIEAARLASEHDARSVADLAEFRPYLGAHQPLDIPDPIGRSAEFFTSVGSQIAELLPSILPLCRCD